MKTKSLGNTGWFIGVVDGGSSMVDFGDVRITPSVPDAIFKLRDDVEADLVARSRQAPSRRRKASASMPSFSGFC